MVPAQPADETRTRSLRRLSMVFAGAPSFACSWRRVGCKPFPRRSCRSSWFWDRSRLHGLMKTLSCLRARVYPCHKSHDCNTALAAEVRFFSGVPLFQHPLQPRVVAVPASQTRPLRGTIRRFHAYLQPPPRRIAIMTLFDNPAGSGSHKPKLMNTLHPTTPLYKTFWTYAPRSPDLNHLL